MRPATSLSRSLAKIGRMIQRAPTYPTPPTEARIKTMRGTAGRFSR
jgi:hypothetical protein